MTDFLVDESIPESPAEYWRVTGDLLLREFGILWVVVGGGVGVFDSQDVLHIDDVEEDVDAVEWTLFFGVVTFLDVAIFFNPPPPVLLLPGGCPP